MRNALAPQGRFYLCPCGRHFSRDEESKGVIVCTVMSGRYAGGPYVTSFYLYFSDPSIQKAEDMDYYRELSNGCVLAAKTRILE